MSPEYNQESWLVIGERSGQIVPKQLVEQEVFAVPLVEHYIHLQNVISALAELSLKKGFISSEGPSEKTYDEETAPFVREGVSNQIPGIVAKAEDEFAKAAGFDLMIEQGEDKTKVRNMQREMYSKFLLKYRFPKNAKVAVQYREELTKKVEFFSANKSELMIETLQNSSDPHSQIIAENESANTSPDKMPMVHDRIRAIFEDPRAGFLPYTHLEKNTVLTYIDYIDSPQYIRGVSNQLLEVFNHQQKKQGSGMKEGRRAIESIVYEIGDFLCNARSSAVYLNELKDIIDECPAPHAKIIEEAGAEHSGYFPLVRYMDSVEFLKKSKIKGLTTDHLQTKEFRWASGDEPGKHKIIEDQYTRENSDEVFKERISNIIKNLNIKQLRGIIAEACINEDTRIKFYEARLNDFKKLPESRIFNQILESIDELLEGRFITNVTIEN